MTNAETTPQPADTAAAEKSINWQATKLRERFDKTMDGYHLTSCVIALTDVYYRALAGLYEDPVKAGATLLTYEHESRKPKVEAPEPSRIIVP